MSKALITHESPEGSLHSARSREEREVTRGFLEGRAPDLSLRGGPRVRGQILETWLLERKRQTQGPGDPQALGLWGNRRGQPG